MKSADILIIEDDNDIRNILAEFLSYEGFKVAQATNGQEGLSYVTENLDRLPKLIFLDLMMPVMSGESFLKTRKYEFPALNIPIIVLSAAAEPRIADQGVAFLKKPIDLEDVLRAIKSVKTD
jgi:CheY-like chemotaxis protein